jgi:mercuric ion binding protein
MRRLAIVLAMTAPTAAVAAEKTITLTIANMTCATCPITVKKAIKGVTGVKDVKVDFEKKIAVVVFDDALANSDRIAEASRNAGYPAARKE